MWPFTRRVREPSTGIAAIPVKFNCPANWSNMKGGDRVRHCSQCDRKVYNLSDMTSYEARSLVFGEERTLCVRYYLRPDGMVMTRDCGLAARIRFKAGVAITSVFAILGLGPMAFPVMGESKAATLAHMKIAQARKPEKERELNAAEKAAGQGSLLPIEHPKTTAPDSD